MSGITEARSERVDLRMTPAAKRTLQQAAAITNKTLTEFLLDTGLNAALDTLVDRKVFQLDEKQWKDFMAALSKPPKDNPRLRELLAQACLGKVSCENPDMKAPSAPEPLAPDHNLDNFDWVSLRSTIG